MKRDDPHLTLVPPAHRVDVDGRVTGATDEFDDDWDAPPATWTDDAAPTPEPAANRAVNAGRLTVLPRVELDTGAGPRLLVSRERRYEVLHKLGAGGAGDVYLAEDRDIGRKVAIKQIPQTTRSSKAVARFVREVQTIGRLEHPNIVPIHDVGQDEKGGYYFIMKYVEGRTLEQILDDLRAGDPRAHVQFGIEQRVRIARELMEAVAFAHSKGVIHRDLKPANLMVGPYGEVSVLDWGIAVSSGEGPAPRDTLDREGVLIGTPRYMAPEQARREPVDRRSDVYALCVILHEFLTLRHYLEDIEDVPAMLDAVIHRPVPLASTVRHPHQEPIPMDLSWIIERGVRKDPSERFASVDELLERLSDRSEGRIHVQCPVTFTKRATNEVERAMDRWIVPRMGFLLSAGRVGVLVAAGLMMMLIGAMLVVGVAGVAGATLLLAGAVG